MYLVNTRPDICFAVSTLSQYMCELRQIHWVAAKHVLRYLHGTVGYGLRYLVDSDMHLVGYTDSDWAGSVEDRKSTSGCCFSLEYVVISWFSRKQTSVALSSGEAEYIAACMATQEAEATEATCWFFWAYPGANCYSLRQPKLCADVSESSSS